MNGNIKYNINLIDNKLKEAFDNVSISDKQNDDSFIVTVSEIKGEPSYDQYKVIFKLYAKDLLAQNLNSFSLDYYANPMSMESDLINNIVFLSSINDILVNIIKHKRFNSEYLNTVTEQKLPYFDIQNKKLNVYLSVIKNLFKEYNIDLTFNKWETSAETESTKLDSFMEKEVSAELTCDIDYDGKIDLSSIRIIENIIESEFKGYAKNVKINMYNKQLTVDFEVESKEDLINIDIINLIK